MDRLVHLDRLDADLAVQAAEHQDLLGNLRGGPLAAPATQHAGLQWFVRRQVAIHGRGVEADLVQHGLTYVRMQDQGD